MRLSIQQSRELLERYGVFANSVCDRCGLILGPLRFTRRGEPGEWCSRKCRDGAEAHAPRTCRGCGARLPEGKRRGTLYCDDACRKSAERSRSAELSRTKTPISASFRTDFRAARHETLPARFEAQIGHF